MATKKCSNGHQYDSNIYGDNCPFCPSNNRPGEGHTQVNNPGATVATGDNSNQADSPTVPVSPSPVPEVGGTVIRRKDGGVENRRLVGVLVSYKVYEGRTVIGKDPTSDLCIEDESISRQHFLIQYVEAKDVFRAQDMGSSNGSYVNGNVYVLGDIVELKTHDIIVLGRTKFIFLAIPQF